MMKKMFRVVLFGALICLSAMVSAQEKADIQFKKKEINLGTVDSSKGKNLLVNFVFTNSGKEPLVIYKSKATCSCTQVRSWPKKPVMPGKQDTIKVIYSPKGQHGRFSKNIFVESNAVKDVCIIKIKGETK